MTPVISAVFVCALADALAAARRTAAVKTYRQLDERGTRIVMRTG
jgi:hypothetical protein